MGSMTVTHTELLEDGPVFSSVWWPYEPAPAGPDLRPLIPQKQFTEEHYLNMLRKLLPFGHIWNFPVELVGD
jgi:hypothetical protein